MKHLFALLLVVLAFAPAAGLAADQAGQAIEKRAAPVGVGDLAPDFTLEDQDGRSHTLSAEQQGHTGGDRCPQSVTSAGQSELCSTGRPAAIRRRMPGGSQLPEL
jgi:hypothetical protein